MWIKLTKLSQEQLVHEQYISGLEYNLRHRWRPIEDVVNFQSNCPEKMVLDKLTSANNAYRDKKKAVISFSSGEREINVHVRNPNC